MTPVPETDPSDEEGITLSTDHYIAALERKNALLLRENTMLDAVVHQLQAQIADQ